MTLRKMQHYRCSVSGGLRPGNVGEYNLEISRLCSLSPGNRKLALQVCLYTSALYDEFQLCVPKLG
jgi:hypothetical protein